MKRKRGVERAAVALAGRVASALERLSYGAGPEVPREARFISPAPADERDAERLTAARERHRVPEQEEPCRRCNGVGFVPVVDVARLKELRVAAGLSQGEVARRAGWQANMVSELESGRRSCTWASAERYLEALGERGEG